MLKSLYIKNYALINELTVEFAEGLTILTGETGAGKSIIIDALSMILGERADSDVVRKGSDKAIVEAVFVISRLQKLQALLLQHEFDTTDELTVRREISVKGQSRCFINDTPATISILKQIGDRLVDLHGQHEHQSLLHSEMHIEMLDEYSETHETLHAYRNAYESAVRIIKEKESLLAKKQQLEEQRTLYEFQLREINAINPAEEEEGLIEQEIRILENSERLSSEATALYEVLYDGERSVTDLFAESAKHLDLLTSIDPSLESSKSELVSARTIVEELASLIREYRAKIEHKPERLEELRIRLGQLIMLKKKYGGTLEAVLSRKHKAEIELALADNFDAEVAALENKLTEARNQCSSVASRLTVLRHEGAKRLDKEILHTLGVLGIKNGMFMTYLSKEESAADNEPVVMIDSNRYRAFSNGIDIVEFYLSTNTGESPKPLAKVASGGEVSRIMLSLKMSMAGKSFVPLLIFDEIDVGISGRIAQSVGQAMKQLARHHQVIAITHLPQIAGFADNHYVIKKVDDGNRVETRCTLLNEQERIHEVARLMSGEAVTSAGLQNAKELIEFSK